MVERSIRILHLEDSQTDAELVRSELRRSGFQFEHRLEQTREGFLAGLSDFRPDAILADYSLPSFDGLEAFRAAKESRPAVPFIFVTGSMGEDLAVETLKLGATDFVVKQSLGRLGPALRRALKEMAAATEQARLQSILAESEQKYRVLFEHNSDGILVADIATQRFRFANAKICEMLGYRKEELLALSVSDIHPAEALRHLRGVFRRQAAGGLSVGTDIPCLRKDGTVFFADISSGMAEIGGSRCLMGMFRDITGRKAAEKEKAEIQAQFLQAQKMEAIGRLAGGVAHDFNNILTAIIGFSEFLLGSLPSGDPRRDDAAEIEAAARRAAALTRQLLAFSRQQVLEPVVLDVNAVLGDFMRMLKRILGEDVSVEFLPGPGDCFVYADPVQVEQVVMNLAVNARDAMPHGGRLIIAVGESLLGEQTAGLPPDLKPGRYVGISVTDTGSGIDAETLKRIFEPFFTTKGPGKGTGLGLSTVYGIARQSGGTVLVESSPGNGATFKVVFPGAARSPRAEPRGARAPAVAKGSETILILEDDPQVRRLTGRALGQAGYRVLEAATPREAEELASRGYAIDLLLSDVVLADTRSGPDVARKLLSDSPGMRVLFMSGYMDERVSPDVLMSLAHAFLKKPVSVDTLLRTVRETLDAPR